jgi:hypothetical protein
MPSSNQKNAPFRAVMKSPVMMEGFGGRRLLARIPLDHAFGDAAYPEQKIAIVAHKEAASLMKERYMAIKGFEKAHKVFKRHRSRSATAVIPGCPAELKQVQSAICDARAHTKACFDPLIFTYGQL